MRINPIRTNLTRVRLNNGNLLIISYETCVAASTREGAFRTEKKWNNTTGRHLSEMGFKDDPTKPQEYFDNLLESV